MSQLSHHSYRGDTPIDRATIRVRVIDDTSK